jgi:hypothetical protein
LVAGVLVNVAAIDERPGAIGMLLYVTVQRIDGLFILPALAQVFSLQEVHADGVVRTGRSGGSRRRLRAADRRRCGYEHEKQRNGEQPLWRGRVESTEHL